MRKLPIPAIVAMVLGAIAALPISAGQVKASLIVETGQIRGGEAFLAGLRLEVEEGWHIYGRETGDSGLPTRLEWQLPEGFTAEESLYPELRRFEFGGAVDYGMEGKVLIVSRIHPPAAMEPGVEYSLGVKASWLACKESCVPGSARLQAKVFAASSASSKGGGTSPGTPSFEKAGYEAAATELRAAFAAGQGKASLVGRDAAPGGTRAGKSGGTDGFGLALALLLAFLGGIILNLMPCVLPVLSLKITGLVGRSSVDEKTRAAQGLAYGAGIIVSFWAIAGLLLALRAGGRAAGWGFQFQDPRVVAIAAFIFFLVSLNFFGVYEIGTRLAAAAGSADFEAAKLRRGIQDTGQWRRLAAAERARALALAFASGLFATLAATPCTAPFMGAALGWAIVQPAAAALAVFTALGLGMALPYLLISFRPGLVRRLPAPGRWMESLRQAMGFPMVAAALWMAWLLERLSGSGSAFRLLAALIAGSLGAWIWGRWGGPATSRRLRITAAALSLVLVAGAMASILVFTGEKATVPDGGASRAAPRDAPRATEGWEPWSPERLSELLAENRPVFVDFSADWCLSCKLNEAAVLNTVRVRERFRERGVVLLKADWTARSDLIARALEAEGRAGVPLYLLYRGDGERPLVLPEILTRRMVFEALDDLPLVRD